MRFPFFINAGLIFGIVEDESDWQAKIADQCSIAQQTTEEAEKALLTKLRRGGTWGPHTSFGNSARYHTGQTLGEWAAEEAASNDA